MRVVSTACRGTVLVGAFALTIPVLIALLRVYPKVNDLWWIGLSSLGVFAMAYQTLPHFLFGWRKAISPSPPLCQYWKEILTMVPMLAIMSASIMIIIDYESNSMPGGITWEEAQWLGPFSFVLYLFINLGAFFDRLLNLRWLLEPLAVLAIFIALPMMLICAKKAFRLYAVLPDSTKKDIRPDLRGIGLLLVFSILILLYETVLVLSR